MEDREKGSRNSAKREMRVEYCGVASWVFARALIWDGRGRRVQQSAKAKNGGTTHRSDPVLNNLVAFGEFWSLSPALNLFCRRLHSREYPSTPSVSCHIPPSARTAHTPGPKDVHVPHTTIASTLRTCTAYWRAASAEVSSGWNVFPTLRFRKSGISSPLLEIPNCLLHERRSTQAPLPCSCGPDDSYKRPLPRFPEPNSINETHSSALTLLSEHPNQQILGCCPFASRAKSFGSRWLNSSAIAALASRMDRSRPPLLSKSPSDVGSDPLAGSEGQAVLHGRRARGEEAKVRLAGWATTPAPRRAWRRRRIDVTVGGRLTRTSSAGVDEVEAPKNLAVGYRRCGARSTRSTRYSRPVDGD